MIGRRNLLKSFLAAPVAAKTAAKAAIDASADALSASGVSRVMAGAPAHFEESLLDELSGIYNFGLGGSKVDKAVVALLKAGLPLPSWLEGDMIDEARQSSGIDADIFALVSVSAGYKMRMQYNRELPRLKAERIRRFTRGAARDKWIKALS